LIFDWPSKAKTSTYFCVLKGLLHANVDVHNLTRANLLPARPIFYFIVAHTAAGCIVCDKLPPAVGTDATLLDFFLYFCICKLWAKSDNLPPPFPPHFLEVVGCFVLLCLWVNVDVLQQEIFGVCELLKI